VISCRKNVLRLNTQSSRFAPTGDGRDRCQPTAGIRPRSNYATQRLRSTDWPSALDCSESGGHARPSFWYQLATYIGKGHRAFEGFAEQTSPTPHWYRIPEGSRAKHSNQLHRLRQVNDRWTAPWAGNFLWGSIWRLKREILSNFQRQRFFDRTASSNPARSASQSLVFAEKFFSAQLSRNIRRLDSPNPVQAAVKSGFWRAMPLCRCQILRSAVRRSGYARSDDKRSKLSSLNEFHRVCRQAFAKLCA
jgi:hypothetical protein